MSYTVAQNTSFLTIASVAQKIISGVFFFIVSWVIGAEHTDTYFAIFAAIAIFTVIADFGLGTTLTRETSQHPEKAERYLNSVFFAKLFFGIAAIILLVVSREFFHYPSEDIYLVLIAGITLFSDSLRNIFYAVLRSFNNLKYESYGLVIFQIVTLLIGIITLVVHARIIWLVSSFTIASIFHTLYAIYYARKIGKTKIRFKLDKQLFWFFIKLSVPFAISGLLAQLYSYQDSILIGKFLTKTDGGNWARAYKAAFVFQFIPTSLTASLYPQISALYPREIAKIKNLLLGSYRYLLLFSVPLACGTAVFIEPIVQRFLPSFAASAPILEVLIFSVILSFVNNIHLTVLNATHHQTAQTILIGATLVFSVVVNSILIPHYGTIGAALTAIISSGLITVVGYLFTQRLSKFSHRDFFKLCAQIAIPGCLMYIGGFFLLKVNLFIALAIGVIIYLAGILVTGGLDKNFIQHCISKFRSSVPPLEEEKSA
jgi:O-antigen/teichoic acid export membrane protein